MTSHYVSTAKNTKEHRNAPVMQELTVTQQAHAPQFIGKFGKIKNSVSRNNTVNSGYFKT